MKLFYPCKTSKILNHRKQNGMKTVNILPKRRISTGIFNNKNANQRIRKKNHSNM